MIELSNFMVSEYINANLNDSVERISLKESETVNIEYNDTNLNDQSEKVYYNINSNIVSPRLSGIKIVIPMEKVPLKVSESKNTKCNDKIIISDRDVSKLPNIKMEVMIEAVLSGDTLRANQSFNSIQFISDIDVPKLPNIKVKIMNEAAPSYYKSGADHLFDNIQFIENITTPKKAQSLDIVKNNSKSKEEIPPFPVSDSNEEMHEYTTYWGMDEYAHKGLLSALLHNHSTHRYKYLPVLIVYAHTESLSALHYNSIQHKVRLEKQTFPHNHKAIVNIQIL